VSLLTIDQKETAHFTQQEKALNISVIILHLLCQKRSEI